MQRNKHLNAAAQLPATAGVPAPARQPANGLSSKEAELNSGGGNKPARRKQLWRKLRLGVKMAALMSAESWQPARSARAYYKCYG